MEGLPDGVALLLYGACSEWVSRMTCLAVIPARYSSKRLPGKALATIDSVPLVLHVLRRVQRANSVDRVIVATDDVRIFKVVADAGGEAWMTREDHACGTDRVAEVAAKIDASIVVNVQGDEALIEPDVIDAVVKVLGDTSIAVATPITRFLSRAAAEDPNRVKVVIGLHGEAVYFSRAVVPSGGPWWQHIGVYGFQAQALQRFAHWPVSALERSEKLEQLRFIANGVAIRTVPIEGLTLSVDTPEDLASVRETVVPHPS
jgi:3-deoxy-manno-octulosonate cytidylyltransferase (CMP-KDO synthetase)